MRHVGELLIGADHPALPGHFPGRPIVPGVVLLDEVLALLAVDYPGSVVALPQVKFLRPVLPGQRIAVAAAQTSPGRISFHATVDGQDVVRGTAALTRR